MKLFSFRNKNKSQKKAELKLVKRREAELDKIRKTHLRGTEKHDVKKSGFFTKVFGNLGFDVDFFSGALTQVLALVLSVATVFYFGYHLYTALSEGVSTTQVHTITETISIDGTSVYIRDEKVITTNKNGYIIPTLADGERAAKNEQVAGIYATDVSNVAEELRETEAQIALIKKSMGTGALATGLLDSYDALSQTYSEIMAAFADGNLKAAGEMSDEFREKLNRCSYLSGDGKLLTQTLENLTAEKNRLSAEMGKYTSAVNAPEQGYFISATDGFENQISTDVINGFSEESFRKLLLLKAEKTDGTVGKMVENRKWYLAVETLGDGVSIINKDDTVSVDFHVNGAGEREMTVVQSIKTDNGYILLLFCDELAVDECRNRIQNVTINYGEKTGYRVPVNALHTYVGMTGVYTLHGRNVCFRKINVIYEGPGYCIVSPYEEMQTETIRYYKYISYQYCCSAEDTSWFVKYAAQNKLTPVLDLYDGSLGEGTNSVNNVLFMRKLSRGTPRRYGETVTSYYWLNDLENVIVAGGDLYDGKVLS